MSIQDLPKTVMFFSVWYAFIAFAQPPGKKSPPTVGGQGNLRTSRQKVMKCYAAVKGTVDLFGDEKLQKMLPPNVGTDEAPAILFPAKSLPTGIGCVGAPHAGVALVTANGVEFFESTPGEKPHRLRVNGGPKPKYVSWTAPRLAYEANPDPSKPPKLVHSFAASDRPEDGLKESDYAPVGLRKRDPKNENEPEPRLDEKELLNQYELGLQLFFKDEIYRLTGAWGNDGKAPPAFFEWVKQKGKDKVASVLSTLQKDCPPDSSELFELERLVGWLKEAK